MSIHHKDNNNTSTHQPSSFEHVRSQELENIQQVNIPSSIPRLDWTRSQIEAEQTKQLRKVLAHAKQNSPFYAKRLADIDPETFELKDLHKIEPVTKQDVMDNWDDIVTDPALTYAKANQHLEELRDGKSDNYYYYGDNGKYYICATGGSSGRRGMFLWDDDLFAKTSAITFRQEALEDMIQPRQQELPKRTAVICAESYLHGSRHIFPQSPDSERDIKVFPASVKFDDLVQQLNEYQPDRLVAYSSMIRLLCNEAISNRLDIPLKRIMSNSEPLEDETRQLALDIWGINIHNCWGSVELGVAGMEGNDYDGIILAEDYHIVEAVDDSGSIMDSGEADHMLVTRLYGSSFPLIRYEVTDCPIIEWKPTGQAPAYRRITEIRGRSDVLFNYNCDDEPVKVHPMTFRQVLGQYPEIQEYQVTQTGNGANIDLLLTTGNSDAHHGSLTVMIQEILHKKLVLLGLEDAIVKVAVVEKLRRHPESNKLTRFVKLAAQQEGKLPSRYQEDNVCSISSVDISNKQCNMHESWHTSVRESVRVC